MKKFYAFFAAALMSVSVFAAKDVVPSDAVLADYYDAGSVCVCIYVPGDMACNDIVLVGSFHKEGTSWITSPVSDLPHFEPVENYDGWYVASFEPEAEPDAEKGMQAKPVMLDVDGNFNWEYQVGAATVIRGGVQVVAGFAGEIDLINYGADAPNVFTVDAWKQNPCNAVYHNYKITVISDGCDGMAVPFVVGAMNGWAFEQMQLDEDLTLANDAPTYTYYKKMAENSPYQIVSGLLDDEGQIAEAPDWNNADSYMQQNVEGVWARIAGEDGDNRLTHEDAEIVWDLRAEDLRWARCAPAEPEEYTVIRVNLPSENRPEAIEIIGTFDDWQGTSMELLETGWFFVELQAKASQYFKFRSAGLWPNEGGTELEVYRAESDEWTTIGDNELVFGQLWQDDTYKGTPCKWIEMDMSDPENYRWKAQEQGIENIVLTEKAHKVVVDGVIYIVRDNKLFNLQGAQVR